MQRVGNYSFCYIFTFVPIQIHDIDTKSLINKYFYLQVFLNGLFWSCKKINGGIEMEQTSTNKTRDMVISALLIALVFVSTKFINIRLPISVNGGLIHAGNTMLFVAAIIFGKRKGAIAGAFGMGLFDVLSGWLAWAPFTFVVRGVMGYIIGHIAWSAGKKGDDLMTNIFAIIVGAVWMIAGYYLTEVVLYGNWLTPFTSIPGNITQIVIGALIALPMALALKKTKMF